MSPELERITQRAQAEPHARFTALAHHLSEEFLRDTWQRLNRRGATGVDGQTAAAYAADLDAHLADLVARDKRRAYHAPPVRRVHIPKPGQPNKTRPLGIPTVEGFCKRAWPASCRRSTKPTSSPCPMGFAPAATRIRPSGTCATRS